MLVQRRIEMALRGSGANGVPIFRFVLLGIVLSVCSRLRAATWRSGYATVCKTVYSGSIPDVASTFSNKNIVTHRPRRGKSASPGFGPLGTELLINGPLYPVPALLLIREELLANEREHIDGLKKSRAKLIEQRRALVKRDGTSNRNEGFSDRIVAIQAAIEATDRAIAEEEQLATERQGRDLAAA